MLSSSSIGRVISAPMIIVMTDTMADSVMQLPIATAAAAHRVFCAVTLRHQDCLLPAGDAHKKRKQKVEDGGGAA